jgi:hypothetical protein
MTILIQYYWYHDYTHTVPLIWLYSYSIIVTMIIPTQYYLYHDYTHTVLLIPWLYSYSTIDTMIILIQYYWYHDYTHTVPLIWLYSYSTIDTMIIPIQYYWYHDHIHTVLFPRLSVVFNKNYMKTGLGKVTTCSWMCSQFVPDHCHTLPLGSTARQSVNLPWTAQPTLPTPKKPLRKTMYVW